MSKEAVFTMNLEPKLRDACMAEASHRPASQVVREFVQRQREAHDYEAVLRKRWPRRLPRETGARPVPTLRPTSGEFAGSRGDSGCPAGSSAGGHRGNHYKSIQMFGARIF